MVVSKTVAQGEFASVLRDVPRVGVGMPASMHGLCPADLPARCCFGWEGAFFPGRWHLDALTVKAVLCLALGWCWAVRRTLFPGLLLRVLLGGSLLGRTGGCAVVAVAFGECCMEHTRNEVWGYSEHSLETKGLLEELGLLWQCVLPWGPNWTP